MRTLALLLAVPVTIAAAQEAAPPAPAQPAAPAAQAVEKTVAQTASPELVGQVVSELGITPGQAEGAAGALFGVAKGRLAPADFAKVAAAVPNMDGLLAAVPAAAGGSPLDALAAKAGGMTAAAGTLSKLGLKADTVMKLAPTLVKAVEAKGGAEVGALLAGALK
jgi:hypothetical protein